MLRLVPLEPYSRDLGLPDIEPIDIIAKIIEWLVRFLLTVI